MLLLLRKETDQAIRVQGFVVVIIDDLVVDDRLLVHDSFAGSEAHVGGPEIFVGDVGAGG